MKKIFMNHLQLFLKEGRILLTSPHFILLTLVGNGFIGFCSLIFYQLEYGINPQVQSHLDALWWTFSTATTTGYGDITPVTHAGKILGILLMLVGLALFSMYTALFAETFLILKSKERNHRS